MPDPPLYCVAIRCVLPVFMDDVLSHDGPCVVQATQALSN